MCIGGPSVPRAQIVLLVHVSSSILVRLLPRKSKTPRLCPGGYDGVNKVGGRIARLRRRRNPGETECFRVRVSERASCGVLTLGRITRIDIDIGNGGVGICGWVGGLRRGGFGALKDM